MRLTKINGKYELWLPEHRAAREQWDIANGGWEVERTEEVLDALKPSDILFEVGVEEGDLTALFVKESGCEVVMFEPNSRVLPCAKAIWRANNLKAPKDFILGFVSDKNILYSDMHSVRWDDLTEDGMIPDHGFKQLYENYPDVNQITLDLYVEQTGIVPTVINCDIEGSEFQFIKGAQGTLRKHKPIIFMSLHPDFMFESYRHEGDWKEKFGDDKQ